jgi:hypothetical protein
MVIGGGTMGSRTKEQLQRAMRRWQCKTIATNAEVAHWEFGILDLCFFAKFTAR